MQFNVCRKGCMTKKSQHKRTKMQITNILILTNKINQHENKSSNKLQKKQNKNKS